MRFVLSALIVAILLIQVFAHTQHQGFIKKSYRFVRGYPGPLGRWGKGVWGKGNLVNAMNGPTGTGLSGMYGGAGGLNGLNGFGNVGNLGNFGGAGSFGNLGGGGVWKHQEESKQ